MKEETSVNRSILRSGFTILAILCGSVALNGCVLNEKYNAEKARSLNFQRLLAQEEKRTAELDSEVKRTKKELTEFEARNRELTAQVQSAREQMGRLQEEAEAIKESALLERKAMEDMRKGGGSKAKKPAPSADLLSDLSGVQADLPKDLGPKDVPAVPEAALAPKTGATIHVVKPGETLFRISRRYGIDVDRL